MSPMLSGEKLRAIRALRNVSQAELAAKAGISPASIATFETGKSELRSGTVRKLCEALGVTVVYRLGDGTELTGP